MQGPQQGRARSDNDGGHQTAEASGIGRAVGEQGRVRQAVGRASGLPGTLAEGRGHAVGASMESVERGRQRRRRRLRLGWLVPAPGAAPLLPEPGCSTGPSARSAAEPRSAPCEEETDKRAVRRWGASGSTNSSSLSEQSEKESSTHLIPLGLPAEGK